MVWWTTTSSWVSTWVSTQRRAFGRSVRARGIRGGRGMRRGVSRVGSNTARARMDEEEIALSERADQWKPRG